MGGFQLVRGDAQTGRVELGSIEPSPVVEHRVKTPRSDVVTDPLDHLPGLERFAEGRDGPRPPLGAHDVPFGTQLGTQCGDRPFGIVAGAVDSADS